MALALKQVRAVAALADSLYSFLPGSGSTSWRNHVTFASVAEKVGVGMYWSGGSKTTAIRSLLEGVLVHRPERFEPLLLAIVGAGITYRAKQGSPIKGDEVQVINGHVLDLGFRFPDLWDGEFLKSLDNDPHVAAKARAEAAARSADYKISATEHRLRELARLQQVLFALFEDANRSRAGLSLERVLNELFALFDLAPRRAFRLVGEQIDGSFDLYKQTYLLEAKWLKNPVSESHLLTFRGKIEGKSAATRGVFVSLSGISDGAREAITRGKQPNFFVVDGYDLTMVLAGHIALDDFLYSRQRILAEEGEVSVPFNELRSRGRR